MKSLSFDGKCIKVYSESHTVMPTKQWILNEYFRKFFLCEALFVEYLKSCWSSFRIIGTCLFGRGKCKECLKDNGQFVGSIMKMRLKQVKTIWDLGKGLFKDFHLYLLKVPTRPAGSWSSISGIFCLPKASETLSQIASKHISTPIFTMKRIPTIRATPTYVEFDFCSGIANWYLKMLFSLKSWSWQ